MKDNKRADRLDQSPLHLLHRAGQCAERIFEAEIKHGGLTPRQFAVLMTVAQNEGLSQTDLVDRTGIDRSTIADIVRRLQTKSLLQRRRTKEDARAYAVKVTTEGRRVLRIAQPLAEQIDVRVLSALPRGTQKLLIDGLQSLVAALVPPGDQKREPPR